MKITDIIDSIKKRRMLQSLKAQGANIGNVTLSSSRIFLDPSRPWLLSIGDYTIITEGCVILTHDYSLSTVRRVYGEWIGEGAQTHIGNNCFIGMNSIVLMGASIGDNVIVGAGSVVKGNVPDNTVVAGNPARIICSLEEYYHKRIEKTKGEAINCARLFYERFGVLPKPKDLAGFKFLFVPRDEKLLSEYGLSFNCSGDEPEEVKTAFFNSTPYWNCYEDFLTEVFGNGIVSSK